MAENNFRADRLEEAIHNYGIEFDESVKWDNEKMIKLLGDYFINLEPEKYSWGTRYVQSLSTVMLCKHLKDFLKQMGPINPLESEDYIAETKLNGCRCSNPDVELICGDGVKRKIKEIVDNKLKVDVLSFNEKTQQPEFKPVIGWYNNGKKKASEWIKASVGQYNQLLEVTKDHKVYTLNRGYVEAQDIKESDSLCQVYEGLNKTQEQVIMGSFLGDGCIQTEYRSKKSIGAHRINLSNCEKQLDYLKLKLKSLGKYSGKIVEYTSGYGSKCFYSNSHPITDLTYYINNLYEKLDDSKNIKLKRRKTVTREFLDKLSWLGIAIWYMDDGHMRPSKKYINTTNNYCRVNMAINKFNLKEIGIIQEFFESRGFSTTLNKSKGDTFTLNIGSLESQEFFKQVAPYIPKCMEYKLPEELRGLEKISWWEDNKEVQYKLINLENIKFEKRKTICKNGRKYQEAYDIEVADNHNFFADGILVHNCTAVYSPETGFEFFTRRESSSNYLNGNITDKYLFIEKGLISEPKDYKNKFNYRFVLDGELLVEGIENDLQTTQVSIEDYIQSIFSSNAERAKEFQKDGHRLKMVVFDVLYFEKSPAIPAIWEPKYEYGEREMTPEAIQWVEKHYSKYLESAGFKGFGRAKKLYQYLYSLKFSNENDVRKLPFDTRRRLRNLLVNMLVRYNLPFSEVESEDNDKIYFTEKILNSGGEGSILKCKWAPYISDMRSSRGHRAAMKVKQSISSMLGSEGSLIEDFDVFITGANPPKSDRIKDMIGSLSCSIYIKKNDGSLVEHEIANVTGLSHEWKKRMALIDTETGKISLNPEYEGKVIAIDGLALTASKLKFQHATLKNNGILEFKDKNPSECTWDESVLKEMTLTRGK